MGSLESKAIALSLFARAGGLEVMPLDPAYGAIGIVCWWLDSRSAPCSEYVFSFRQLRELLSIVETITN